MRAALYTGGKKPWAEVLGEHPWALLPVAGRPLLSYWLELCVDLGITEVQIILGQDAEYIEMFCGTGAKWGLTINYSFVRDEENLTDYFARDPERWRDGLLFVGAALFPRRRAGYTSETLQKLLDGCCVIQEERPVFFSSRSPEVIDRFIRQEGYFPEENSSEEAGLDFTAIGDIAQYYRLNMEIVRSEMNRYLSSGYSSLDDASIGYNVITPASVTLTPPLAIGNDCRIGAISVIGPGAVISDHVLIDRQCEISDSIILSDTYVGRNLEIKGKIVAGNRIIDPEDGTCLEIEDPWLVAQTRPKNYMRDFLRAVFGWGFALLLVAIQFLPFLFFYSLIRLFGRGRFVQRTCHGIGGAPIRLAHCIPTEFSPSLLLMIFYGGSLDRFPQLFNVLTGKLWLCGHVPRADQGSDFKVKKRYFPAVFSYSDAFIEVDKQMDALYYAHTRSLAADLLILRHALLHRFIEANSSPA